MDHLPGITQIIIDTFSSLINQVILFFPRLIYCTIIVVVGYLVAKGVAILIKNILERIGFNRIGDRLDSINIIKNLKTDTKLSDIVGTITYYFIFLIFLPIATETLGIAAITNMVVNLIGYIPQLIAAVIMLLVGVIIADSVKRWVTTLCQSFNIAAAKMIGSIVFAFFIVITLLSALSQIGINTTLLESSFILILGGIIVAFSIGYGLASKEVLSNLISSFYMKKRFQIGQTIKIGNTKGEIIKIDKLSITIENDESVVTIPFRDFQTEKVELFNHN